MAATLGVIVRSLIVATVLLPGLTAAAHGQQSAAKKSSDKNKAEATDAIAYPIPETPAFTYLGVSPAKVSRPSSVKSLASGIVNGIDEKGKVQQGLAFEFAPGTLLRKSTLADYQTRLGFITSNLKISIGTVRAAGDKAATDGALGLRMIVFDHGDPLASKSFTDSIAVAMGKCAPSGDQPPDDYSEEKTLDCLSKATAPLVKGFAKRHWNRSSLAFAAAVGTQFEESNIRKGRGTGASLWGDYSRGIGANVQWIVALTLRHHSAQTADSSYTAGSGGIRLLIGSPRLNGFAEGLTENRWGAGSAVKTNQAIWSAGVEFLASDNMWISTGFGEGYEDKGKADRVVVFAGLRWGISKKARMMPGG